MTTFESMIAPALMTMFALPALCQDAAEGRSALVDQDIFATLVAADDATVAFADMQLLDTTIVLIGRRDLRLSWVPKPFVGYADVYWQFIGFDRTGGICISDIERLPRQKQDQTQDQADQEIVPQDVQDLPPRDGESAGGGASEAYSARPITRRDEDLHSGLPMSTHLVTDERTGKTQLQVAFEARSNDYDLALVDVVTGRDGAATDVYLYRKLPGPGEGEQDVVEHHSLTIDLFDRGTVRVFLAEGITRRPEAPIRWHALAKLQ